MIDLSITLQKLHRVRKDTDSSRRICVFYNFLPGVLIYYREKEQVNSRCECFKQPRGDLSIEDLARFLWKLDFGEISSERSTV